MDAQLFFTYYRSTYWNPLDWILNRRYIYVIDQYIENTEITKDIASIEKYSNIICESLESIKKATQDMNCLAMLKNWVHLSYLAGTITKNNYIADEKLEENIQNLIQNKKLISPNLRSTTFKMCNNRESAFTVDIVEIYPCFLFKGNMKCCCGCIPNFFGNTINLFI